MTQDIDPTGKERLSALERQVNELADEVLALLESTSAPTRRAGASPPLRPAPAAWIDMDEQQATIALDHLRTWMARVLIHHPHTITRLRPCWYRHPATVQMLLDVRQAWEDAYRGVATDAFPALEWWQRHLPRLEEAISADLGHCTSVRHDPDRVPLPPHDPQQVAAYLAWWGDRRNPSDEPPAI
jgi:hypothetical protein